MRVALAFIKWVLTKVGEGLVKFHRGFKSDLKRETGVALIAWLLVSLLSSALMLIVFGYIEHVTGNSAVVYFWFTYIASCVFYLLYTGFSVMYNTFKAERAELFETIKNGR